MKAKKQGLTAWKIFLILGLFWAVLGGYTALPGKWLQFIDAMLLIIIIVIELHDLTE